MINIYVTQDGAKWTCKDGTDHVKGRGRLSWVRHPNEPEWRHEAVRSHCDYAHGGQPYRLVRL